MDPHDNTEIIDMKKNFQKFMSNDDSRKRSRLDFSGTSLLDSSHASVDQSYGRDSDALKLKTDVIYFRSRIGMLESQLTRKDTDLQEQAILHKREISGLMQKHDRELRGYSVLKASNERLLHRQELCEAELRDEKTTWAQLKQVYDEKLQQLQQKNLEQEISGTQLLDEQKAKCRELRNKLLSLQVDLSVSSSELSLVKEQFSDLKKKLSDSLNSGLESDEWRTRATQAEERLKVVEAELAQYNDDIIVMLTRKQDLAKLAQISDENKKLHKQVSFYKITVENIEVMKEKVRTLERQMKNHDELQTEVARLQVENESYSSKLFDIQTRQIPEDTVIRLHEAQEREAVMLENIGELKSMNGLLESQVRELEKNSTSLKSRLSGAGDDGEARSRQVLKLQRSLILLSKERDGYKTILDSYESNTTREIIPRYADKITQLQQAVTDHKKACEELEAEFQVYQQENTKLKQEIIQLQAAVSKGNSEPSLTTQLDQALILELRQKVEELEKKCEILECRIEQRNLQGDYDPTKTKVLHFSMNPSSMAEKARADDVRLLREEQVKLRERIKVLERNLSEAHDITAQVDANLSAPSAREMQQLKDIKGKLASSEKKNERMMEMFKKTSLEFRQTVYQLTGFRIDVPKSKQYKLMHMYSSSPHDYLLFQETSEAELQLLENDYAKTLVELAEEHLQGQASIPVFLSSLTIDLFKQSTMMSSMM